MIKMLTDNLGTNRKKNRQLEMVLVQRTIFRERMSQKAPQ